MPIHDLREKNIAELLPELGRIRKGAEKPERGAGRELPHWRFTPHEDYPEMMGHFESEFGAEPTEVGPLFVHGGDPVKTFDPYMEKWRGKLLDIRCDTTNRVKYWVDQGKSGAHHYDPLPCLRDTDEGCDCKQKGMLSFSLRKLEIASGRMGVFVFTVTAWKDIQQITAMLKHIWLTYCIPHRIPLDQVPFVLTRTPDFVHQKKSDGSFSRRKAVMAYLNPHESFIQQMAQLSVDRPLMSEETGEIFKYGDYDEASSIASKLAALLAIHVPDLTLVDWCNKMHITPEDLETHYADFDTTRLELMKFVAENDYSIDIQEITPEQRDKGWRYSLNAGIAQVWAFSREKFREAGYEVDGWQAGETIRLDEPMIILAEKATDKDYFTVSEVMAVD